MERNELIFFIWTIQLFVFVITLSWFQVWISFFFNDECDCCSIATLLMLLLKKWNVQRPPRQSCKEHLYWNNHQHLMNIQQKPFTFWAFSIVLLVSRRPCVTCISYSFVPLTNSNNFLFLNFFFVLFFDNRSRFVPIGQDILKLFYSMTQSSCFFVVFHQPVNYQLVLNVNNPYASCGNVDQHLSEFIRRPFGRISHATGERKGQHVYRNGYQKHKFSPEKYIYIYI